MIYRFFEERILTEENTDAIVEIVQRFVPWGLGGVAGFILDRFLPEKALQALTLILVKLGITSSERQRHPNNPFRDHPWKAES